MAKAIRHLRNERQKSIVKRIDELTGKYSRWVIWQDFITMTACSISNIVDAGNRESREKIYREHAGKYSPEELTLFSEMLSETSSAMEEDADQDFLGELFMALELGNEWKGQFFTPYSVCRAMSSISYSNALAEKIDTKGWASVNDPACGAGALLIAFANEMKRRGINYQRSVLFVAQDIDFLAGCMCYIQLSLMGCPGYVVIDDSLIHPSTSYDNRGLLPRATSTVWYTPMYCSDIWVGRRKAAIMDSFFRYSYLGKEKPEQEPAAPPTEIKPHLPEKEELHIDGSGQLSFF